MQERVRYQAISRSNQGNRRPWTLLTREGVLKKYDEDQRRKKEAEERQKKDRAYARAGSTGGASSPEGPGNDAGQRTRPWSRPREGGGQRGAIAVGLTAGRTRSSVTGPSATESSASGGAVSTAVASRRRLVGVVTNCCIGVF